MISLENVSFTVSLYYFTVNFDQARSEKSIRKCIVRVYRIDLGMTTSDKTHCQVLSALILVWLHLTKFTVKVYRFDLGMATSDKTHCQVLSRFILGWPHMTQLTVNVYRIHLGRIASVKKSLSSFIRIHLVMSTYEIVYCQCLSDSPDDPSIALQCYSGQQTNSSINHESSSTGGWTTCRTYSMGGQARGR